MDRTADERATAEALRAMCYGPSRGKMMILDTVIPATAAYRKAASAQQPVHRFEPTRRGFTARGLESLLCPVQELPIGLETAVLAPGERARKSRP